VPATKADGTRSVPATKADGTRSVPATKADGTRSVSDTKNRLVSPRATRYPPAFSGKSQNMIESPSVHVPVLLDQVVYWLTPRPGGIYVDGTLGGGGHAEALSEAVGSEGLVIGIDRDPVAIEAAVQRRSRKPMRFAQANFCNLPEVLEQLGIERIDGMVLDLGLSSDQLADADRGFSFSSTGPLDLRFDPTEGEPAHRLVNRLSAEHLQQLISSYGEERYSRRIALAIVERRRQSPIGTSAELAELIRSVVPKTPDSRRIDPATRTFQALRIAVNEELKSLEIALRRIPDCLRSGGRLAIISFHSLEDRRVKEAFRADGRLEALTRRPIVPDEEEMARNPRSRSAKLRVAERKSS
jgi:16S rRNA (cytosine1402-N4)-methyltransferase